MGELAQSSCAHCVSERSVLKSLYLAVREASQKWLVIHHWKPALQTFLLMFGEERVPLSAL
jgi:putative transposase